MTRLALSTMYAQHPRFEDGAVFARHAREAGYDAIEISHSTPESKVRQVLAARALPVAAIHAPAPWQPASSGTPNCDLNLAAADITERREAVGFARESIGLAARAGADSVVVHLGHVGHGEPIPEDLRLRAEWDDLDDGARNALREAAVRERERLTPVHLEAARHSLHEILPAAREAGVVIGIESRVGLHELPLPGELAILLDGLDDDHAGYWHDVGHVEVLHRLGYADRSEWFTLPGVRVVGGHVHDVDGFLDHRAPGRGDVDWSQHLPWLKHLDTVTLEINQYEPDGAVTAATALLRANGL